MASKLQQPNEFRLSDVVHPILKNSLEGTTRQNALILRDALRSRVGQLGEDGSIDITSDEKIFNAMSSSAPLTTSCGPSAYLYYRMAQECNIDASIISILWDKPGGEHGQVLGHTLNEIKEGRRRWILDLHAGNVWQKENRELASSTEVARAMLLPVKEWDIYPSSHGQSATSWLYGLLRYTFGFWGFDIEQKMPPKRVAVISHSVRNRASMPAASVRWYSLSEEPDLTLSGVGFDSSKARYYWNGRQVKSSQLR